MADGSQEIHRHLEGSMPISGDNNFADPKRVPDSLAGSDGQSSYDIGVSRHDSIEEGGHAHHLQRICRTLELQAAIAEKNQLRLQKPRDEGEDTAESK